MDSEADYPDLEPPWAPGKTSAATITTALARLMAVLHTDEMLTEGQLSSITMLDRVQVRTLIDDGRSSLLVESPKAAFLKAVMRKVSASRTYDEVP